MKCGTCNYFNSYAAIYYDDLEPYDMGECHHAIEGIPPSDQCGISIEDSCENWEG